MLQKEVQVFAEFTYSSVAEEVLYVRQFFIAYRVIERYNELVVTESVQPFQGQGCQCVYCQSFQDDLVFPRLLSLSLSDPERTRYLWRHAFICFATGGNAPATRTTHFCRIVSSFLS